PATLTDAGVHRSFDQRPDLHRCLAELTAVAADVGAARALVSAAWEAPVRETLRGLAARGFQVDEGDLWAERADLRIHYDLDPTGPSTTIVLSTPRSRAPRGSGTEITPSRSSRRTGR
ncbi:MAG: hypothetical protein ABMB14_38875, partial [Myxococcota bacterium]